MRLKGKIALVTGAGRGIGGAIARGFAREGADVALVSRTAVQLQAQTDWISANTSSRALVLEADVADPEQAQRAVEQTLEAFGRIDVLVNAAGITMVAPSESLAYEDWQKCLRINLDGTFHFCQQVGRDMIRRGEGGSIINITSVVAHAGIPQRAAYAASKGGVMQLTQNLAVEWARHRIRVNAISPGFIRTEIVEELIRRGVHRPEKLEARIPLGRMGTPDDLVGPAVFLASDESAYITGVVLKVDGGWLANGYV